MDLMTPNWFAAIMGTGIVATSGVALHSDLPGLSVVTTGFWLLASVGLVITTILFLRAGPTEHAGDPTMAHFYGAPAMALLTVGAGTIELGPQFLGDHIAVWVGGLLWLAGTAVGLFTAVWIPFRMITGSQSAESGAMPSWLMPVVPPMVSAATGSLLIGHISAGQLRLGVLATCYGMFGLSLIVGFLTIGMVYSRLVHQGLPSVNVAPTVWIMLGMIGQSITAAVLLGNNAALVFEGREAPIAAGLHILGIGYGLVMSGFAVFVFLLAVSITVHNARRGMGFTAAWWSFTFPVGTCVTGSAALAFATDSGLLQVTAGSLYVLLLLAWGTVASRSLAMLAGRMKMNPSVCQMRSDTAAPAFERNTRTEVRVVSV
ncbi:tellurite resistance protein TehA-like permease [Williamsia limnetica]|uniref:Tellurite resistance protein TehA-like permease n=2 Tax=Williamsia limnetica TaxID=882452 RepID=A0A318RRG7_WILLI|nr:tellurite resistance protein TehA-like permease [Williamsia limnetica]